MDFGSIFTNTAAYLFSPITLAYALAATGLAVHFGYAGLLNFGMAAFMAIGGYGYAISVLSFGLPWFVGMLIGLLGGALFAVLLGIPTLRLRADYLAIATIAAGEIVRLLFTTQVFDEFTNSADGLAQYNGGFRDANPFPPGTYGFGPWTYTANDLWNRVFGLIVLALAVLLVWALMRSPWGRVLKGIREDEDAVRSLGKNVFAYKMQALVVGGVLGAAGGIVFVLPSAVVPGSYSTSLTFFLWTILLLGGAATVFGPTLGAVLFWVVNAFLASLLPQLANAGLLPMTDKQAATVVYIVVGVALMLLVIFRPQGILGDKREMTFVK
ncbi:MULTISPECIES: branched-chain amino acid ABC transporter permease [Microbacterium]|jgi:neutral amino acid transport system permease protein|uniref:Branched-chain amino acid ABC transporter permease n=1 Tax=Microbacterium galbinum TaxID=2851646 RepID=A0ABY4IU91_9MICO|nr:branched-chain amino acid ABC transporter permease [Microbacterium galbinum]MCK2022500.1 branched-chain amino acid ABC transporter permease [Microbacterium galbinum]UPL14938.1 branched-chain amino acid ABC transporter permease [Microbacterium galbinum]